jgi:two-component system sensor histidine kinase UhpB
VSSPITQSEVAILAAGILALLSVNVLVLRWGLSPLDRLVRLMQGIDLARAPAPIREDGPAEIRTVIATFNTMLHRLSEERRAAGRVAIGAQEAERARLARELHDEIGQGLTAVVMALARTATAVPAEVRDDVLSAQEAARSSLEEVRRVAQRLRPASLDDLGLPRAVTTLCRRFEATTDVRFERRIASDLAALDDERDLVIYRVAQESLTNIARHAEAGWASLELRNAPDAVVLRVCDDGRGIGGRPPGSGITGMRERALLVDADLVISERLGGGVEVRLEVPVSAMAGVA